MSFFNPDLEPPFRLPLSLDMLSPVAQATATAELRERVLAVTHKTMQQVGFGWQAADVKERTATELAWAVKASTAHHDQLLISNAKIAKSILLDPVAEGSLRFLRAIAKSRQKDLGRELLVDVQADLAVVDELVMAGTRTLASVYVYGALQGESYLRAATGSAPLDPRAFTLDVLTLGITEALLMELERREDARRGGLRRAA